MSVIVSALVASTLLSFLPQAFLAAKNQVSESEVSKTFYTSIAISHLSIVAVLLSTCLTYTQFSILELFSIACLCSLSFVVHKANCIRSYSIACDVFEAIEQRRTAQ